LTSRAVDMDLKLKEHIFLRKRDGIVWYGYSRLSWIDLLYLFVKWACRISKVYSGIAYQPCKAWLDFGSGVNLADDHACVINSECQNSQSASTWNCERSSRS
jgi:hypothetical protein